MSTIKSIFGQTTLIPDHSPYFKAAVTRPKGTAHPGYALGASQVVAFNTVLANNFSGIELQADGKIKFAAGLYYIVFSHGQLQAKYGQIHVDDSSGNTVILGFAGVTETYQPYASINLKAYGIVQLAAADTLSFMQAHSLTGTGAVRPSNHLPLEIYSTVDVWGLDKARMSGSLHRADQGIKPVANDSGVSAGEFWVDSSDAFKLKYKDGSGTSHEVSLS